jgi:hypothetical protein
MKNTKIWVRVIAIVCALLLIGSVILSAIS